jgi:hypothetical protein
MYQMNIRFEHAKSVLNVEFGLPQHSLSNEHELEAQSVLKYDFFLFCFVWHDDDNMNLLPTA